MGFTMLLEAFGLVGILTLFLFIFAQLPDKAIIGVFASMVLLILGAWTLTDPIAIQSSERTIGITNLSKINMINESRISGSSNKTFNETTNSSYSPINIPSYVSLNFSNLISLTVIVLSMYGMLHYGLKVGRDLNA